MAKFIGTAMGKTPAETVKTGSDILKDRQLFAEPVKRTTNSRPYSARPLKGGPAASS